ncbi:hypothetical protein Tco_0844104 [Tanacetum coccineum]
MLGRQMELLGDETEIVPLYYHIVDNFQIQFCREEFCLVTRLRFGVEYWADYNNEDDPIPFRRRVFSSAKDGKPITGKTVEKLIKSQLFYRLNDDDAVSLCCVDILQFVLLGLEDRRGVPDWILRLANDRYGMKAIKNDYDTNVMYDMEKVAGKLQIFVSHNPIDLITVLIPNDGYLEESFAGTKIHALYYKIPHNGFSITVKLRNNYDMHVMFDISSANYKLEIYIDHLGVNFIIAKYIFPNASLEEMMSHVITDFTSESEDHKKEQTQNDYTFDQMVEWAEQEHFEHEETKEVQRRMGNQRNPRKTIVSKLQRELEAEATLANQLLCNLTRYFEQMRSREIQMMMLQNMPTMSLNSYGLHALLMTHEADIRTTNNLITARQELLRSIAVKQNFINIYMAI